MDTCKKVSKKAKVERTIEKIVNQKKKRTLFLIEIILSLIFLRSKSLTSSSVLEELGITSEDITSSEDIS